MQKSHVTKDKQFLQYMGSLNKYKILTKEQEYDLAKKFAETKDPKYAHALVTANLKFVAKVVYKYANTGHEMMDLIQEGNEGLMAAVRKFDPDKGYKLITYAVWWIKAYVNRYIISNHSQVKLGTTQAQRMLFFKLRSTKAEMLHSKNGEDVTAEELAEVLECEVKDIQDMEVRLAGRDFSLQSQINGEESGQHHTFQDSLVDQHTDQSTLVENSILADKLKGLIEKLDLNVKERYIIQHRLMNTDPVTLQVIGEKFMVSRERIRQIEANLKHKIKAAIMREERKVSRSTLDEEFDIGDDADDSSTGIPDLQGAQT